jgi:hypothetical protein
MATIKLKTSTSSGNVPASLSKGEVAINVADGVWYYGGASAVQQNFKFGSVTVTGNTSLDGKLVVTGNTVLNGTLSATTSLKVGNGDGSISASSVTGTILKGVLGSDATPVTAYINAGEIDNVAIGSETRLTSLKTTSIDINPSEPGTIPVLLKAHASPEGNWVTITNSEDDVKFQIDSGGRTTIATATLTNGTISTADINAGNIDGTAIGTTSRSTGKFTTMDVNSTLVVTGNTVLNGTLSATTSLKVGNGNGSISGATITSSGDMTAGGDVYTDVLRRQSDSSTTTKIKLDDETVKTFGGSSSVWTTKVESQKLLVGQAGAGVISASTIHAKHTLSAGTDLYVDGDVELKDDGKLKLGNAGDLEIYHDSNNSYIDDTGTGTLFYRSGTQTFQNAAGSKTMAVFNAASTVDLSFNNNVKLSTNTSGVHIDGTVSANTAVYAGTGVDDGIISGGTVQGSYQFITFVGNTGGLSDDEWTGPSTNGISNHSWTENWDGVDGLSTGSTVINLSRTEQMSYIRVPAGARLIGLEGSIRSSVNDRAYAGLFTFLPDYEGPNTSDATLRILVRTPSSTNNLTNDPQSIKEYAAFADQHVFADGECIVPAFRRDSSSTQTLVGSLTIILKY